MTKKDIEKAYKRDIKKIVNAFKKHDPERIILFGSAASGRIHTESDIDICFLKENADSLQTKRALRESLWISGYSWEREPDIHVFDTKLYRNWLLRGDPFVSEVEKGKIVYAR